MNHTPPGQGGQPGASSNPGDRTGHHPAPGGPTGPADPQNPVGRAGPPSASGHGPGAPGGPGRAAHQGPSAPHGPAGPDHPTGYTAPFHRADPADAAGQAGRPGPYVPADASGAHMPGPSGPHAPQSGQAAYGIAPPAAPRPRGRGVPVWMALSGMLVVALIAGGAGGVAGGLLNGSASSDAAPEDDGPVMNEPPPEAPQRDPDTIAGVAQRVSPSVVSLISADARVPGGGSGFVIDGDYVVTNDHVSSGLEADGIVIEYSDGTLSEASVVGADPSSDLAVLSIADPHDVEPLQFGDSEEVIVGDEVIAIGAPLGLNGTVTQGIISAVNRPVSSGQGESGGRFYALQTDAAINPGNSGGPLVDTRGRVIGVNSMIATMGAMGETSGNIGLGFAIPSVEAERVVNRLMEDGETAYADIGADIDEDSPLAGAVIAEGADAVEPGGPADEAGLEPGDVIVSLDSRQVGSGEDLLAMLRSRAPGDEAAVDYERDGERESTTIVLGSTDD
ncbi:MULTISPECIES: trypsin-like peptidase domain-containing protein [Nocardiopsidaceae]|uniref:Trypsin-like peptidase domain-containing protein n=1 Tax=Streptomonospora nanhaiensis TaxID=1323731 RepID=A0ABY6YQB7_9ACTN|nr:trypsin-like peptidase domain-containing protein [Streptomonospora nanhaiensis]WAE74418.1 trypsin-like peptidase domain-containing protein [Streptomonospora nanhaiensis]